MSSQRKVRVRFAPSPTGGLHLGGVRTALFNYLYARHHGGDFILRIEDTDQTRFVSGAEEYINECLDWCGLTPDESPNKPGEYAPYRQSERKATYRQYAEQLVHDGFAYYAFDTPEELDAWRKEEPNFRYSHENRLQLRNSLSLSKEETTKLLSDGHPHTIRIKIPAEETVSFEDMIRGRVTFETSLIDDKVLLKADGMPTYHLAVVIDDKAMEISHVFRGEEWLPSAPVHILLWEYLGWKDSMPCWAHLPLILKPDGNGKLSKRDGDRLGFPVYAMNWTDAKSGDVTKGFREMGFLPEAFINMLAVLGWNDGTEQEIFGIEELISKFSVDRVSKAGAKFDFEKAKWFNHEWIKKTDNMEILPQIEGVLNQHGITLYQSDYVWRVLALVKERMTFVEDFWEQASFFFTIPDIYDVDAVKPKWNASKTVFFQNILHEFAAMEEWSASDLEPFFKGKIADSGMKIGELMMPFRIMLVGGKFGPDVFQIAETLGKEEVIKRIEKALPHFA
ncbi:glutamate--tRNA ligase [Sphingobacterium phlebotomi]|uniref:Glutamate--tRNA ligase n=1 Tax=Sphingobacterium phlebotomi TaxID=2605433 RepID=A0A5D4HBA2_9SPHI|nr:glutamate--tRNA ligase [Sphingobacterium phlebotomi]TYR37099.1 glutamate--tRNA ligase [Sphingobacterium phlebotomi]